MITPWSFRLLVCSCLLWALASAGNVPLRPRYWVTCSKTVQPGHSMLISTFLRNATRPVTLRMELMDYEGRILQNGRSYLMNVSEAAQTFHFPISSTVPKPSRPMFLHVVGWGGLEFNDFEEVSYNEKRATTIFMEMDKHSYVRGQTVRFRALAMLSNTTLSDAPLNIVIREPYSNQIAQWTRKQGTKGSRVLEGELVTSVKARPGIWRLEANVDGVSETVNFYLMGYENVHRPITHRSGVRRVVSTPPRAVKLIVPVAALLSDPVVPVKVSARNSSSGTPIQGLATVTLWLPAFRSKVYLKKNVTLDIDGEGHVNFNKSEFLETGQRTYRESSSSYYRRRTFMLDDYPFMFNATVRDNTTGHISSSSAHSLRFVSHLVKLRFFVSAALYKPGLPYFTGVKGYNPVSYNAKLPQNVSVTFIVTSGRDRRVLLNETVQLDSDGNARMILASTPDTTRKETLEITATVGTFSVRKTVRPMTSPSNNIYYLHIERKTMKPEIGKEMEMEVYSNKPLGSFIYQVYASRRPIMTRTVVANGNSSSASFSFLLTVAMAPTTQVIVLIETHLGALMYKHVSFHLDFSLNKVTMEFLDENVKPGEPAKLKVSAASGTTVFLTGIDTRSSSWREKISNSDIKYALMDYGGMWGSRRYGTSEFEYFLQYLGVGVVTNVPRHKKYSRDGPRPYTNRRRLPKFKHSNRAFLSPLPPPGPANRQYEKKRPENQRTFFSPDTWLWDRVHIGDKGSEVLTVKTPDIVGRLRVTGFGVHPTLGLRAVSEPAEVETWQRLFVTMDVPKYAILGETVCFSTITYNLHSESITANIKLLNNATAFKNVLVIPDPQNPGNVTEVKNSGTVEEQLGVLTPNAKVTSKFCVKPIMLGDMLVHVRVQGNEASDDIVKTIRIKPEGVQHFKTYPVLIEITGAKNFYRTVALPKDVVKDAVKGSVRVSVSVNGNIMANVASNLQDLLKMPTGSGEKNMIHFAPIISLIGYLKQSNLLSPAFLRKAKGLVMAGYQSQLRYQRYDGGFSAFGSREKTGSMWLTAFVVKTLVQATYLEGNGIFIERDVIRRAVGWITQFQKRDGSFREPGTVFHQSMQGGSGQRVRLTAHATIALLKAKDILSGPNDTVAMQRVSCAVTEAVLFLESQLSKMEEDDSYTSCILADALTLAGSSKADKAVSMMNKMAITEGNLKYWSGRHKPLSIEMTSHALLTQKRRNSYDAFSIFLWLNSQRGPTGGFIFAYDTALGIEALSSMTELANVSPINVEVTWTSCTKSAVVDINKDSVLREHKLSVPVKNNKYPMEVTITAKSPVTGNKRVFALAEVVIDYSVDNKEDKEYKVEPMIVRKNSEKAFILKPCLSRYGDNITMQTNSIVMMEIGVPTGYKVNWRKSRYGKSSSVDYLEDKVVLYYYKSVLGSVADCPVMKMDMDRGTVAHSKDTPIVVYDNHNPEKKYIITYRINNYKVCDVVTDMKGCSTDS